MGIQVWERWMERDHCGSEPSSATHCHWLCDLSPLTQLPGPKSPRWNIRYLRFPLGGAILPYSWGIVCTANIWMDPQSPLL